MRGFVHILENKTESKEIEEGVYRQAEHLQHMSKRITVLRHRKSESGDSAPFSAYHHWGPPGKMKGKIPQAFHRLIQ